MLTNRKWLCVVAFTTCGVLALLTADVMGRGGRGGGGGGGGGRVGGGGMSRPSGGGISRPSGGVSRPSAPVSRPNPPSINRTPSVSPPRVNTPSVGTRPAIQPKVGGGPVGGNRPGVVTPPGLTPGTRPGIDAKGPGIGPKVGGGPVVGGPGTGRPGIGGPGVGKPGVGGPGVGRPGVGGPSIGKGPGGPGGGRPTTLPGLGTGLAGGFAAAKAGDYLGRRQGNIADRKQNIADRSDNLSGRLEQRQDFRNMSQDQRQDYLNNRREDWQNWHDDYYHHHDGWYHGAWGDHWGDHWSHMWSDHTAAMVLGTTWWGLNRMNYWFGTSEYYNPYYTEPLVVDNTTISYAEPLAAPPVSTAPTTTTTPATTTEEVPPGATPEGIKQFDAARTAFYSGDYLAALTAVNKAVAAMPTDAVIHEFRALVLFALGRYHDAAVTLHPVLAVGPGWDWTTMSSLFPDTDTYTKKLRALEEYITNNPTKADARFLLAYHYLTCGHKDQAIAQLAQVQKAVPKDAVTAQLLQMLGATPEPVEVPESKAKIDAAQVVGTWSATRGKASFEMTLAKDNSFTWAYREGKKKEEVKGVFAIDGNVLALEPDAGGVMLAEINLPAAGSLGFRTVGAPPSDKGLTFQKK